MPRLSLYLAVLLCLGACLVAADRGSRDDDDDAARGRVRDVCIIGAGPSGLSAAAFAKDRGLSVLVFDDDNEYGGNCNTEFFTPPFPGAPGWIDIGTAAFPDTNMLRILNNDTWTIDSAAIAQRFASLATGNNGSNLIYLDLTNPASQTPTYLADFARGVNYGAATATNDSQAALGAALGRWMALQRQYPFVQQSKWPSPIPAPLLVPLSQAIETYQLQAMFPLFSQIMFGGGLPDYTQVPLLYALAALKPSLIYLLSVPNVGFSVAGGCIQMYNGMVKYIGAENVLLGAEIIEAERPQRQGFGNGKGNGNGPFVELTYTLGSGSRRRPSSVKCRNLIVAFPQTLSAIDFLEPDWKEKQAFSDFFYHYIYTLELDISGGIAAQPSGFTLLNFDLSSYAFVPQTPAIAYLQRGLPYGPASAPLISKVPLTAAQQRAAFLAQTRSLPADLLTVNGILASDDHDQYYPMLPSASLAQDPTPFKRIQNLNAEGYRSTYWISTTLQTPDTVNCWQLAYNIVQSLRV